MPEENQETTVEQTAPETTETDNASEFWSALTAEAETTNEDADGTSESKDDSEPTTIKIGEVEYDQAELNALIEAGKTPHEIHKAATQKFQEASELKKQAEALHQEHSDLKALSEMWQTPEGRAALVEGLMEERRKLDGDTAVQQDQAIDTSEFTDNELILYQQNQVLLQQVNDLKAAIVPAIEDVKAFVGTEKEQRKADQTIRQVKQELGVDLSYDQLKEMQSKGISDPVEALKWFGQRFKAKEEVKAAPSTPQKSSVDTFDDNDPNLSAGQMFQLLMAGKKPASQS